MLIRKHSTPQVDNGRFLLAESHNRLVVLDDVDDGRLNVAGILRVPAIRFPLRP